MASGDDYLQCGLCLSTFSSPKFLPCHHTYCEGCLQALVTSRGSKQLRCPQCRHKFQLPPGGVSGLQTNFYLTPLLGGAERCPRHITEFLRFYCSHCRQAICRDCRLTDHFSHHAQDLGPVLDAARTELTSGHSRLQDSSQTLTSQLTELQTSRARVTERKAVLNRLYTERSQQLKRKLDTMITECLQDLQEKVESCAEEQQRALREEEKGAEKRLRAVSELQQQVEQTLSNNNSSLLSRSAELRDQLGVVTNTCGDGQGVVTNTCGDGQVATARSVLRFEDLPVAYFTRDVIAPYLGQVQQFTPVPLHDSVTLQQAFRCVKDSSQHVHALHSDPDNDRVYVAYGGQHSGAQGRVAGFTRSTGQRLNLTDLHTKGRVCLGGLRMGWVRVEGAEFPAKDLLPYFFRAAPNRGANRKYDVYNKGRARFVLRVHHSGLCDLRAVTIDDTANTRESRVCEVSAKTPIAMDVSRDGQLMAVLEEGLDHVMLYRHGNKEPHATYRGNAEAFRPLDACFYMIGGEERLVISGWLNALHVVEVGESCKLIGHVGWECPELVKPTALYTDGEGGRG